MKPFNLQEALNGTPVLLRNGCKAFVVQDIRKTFDQYELHCPETIYPLLIICDWAYWRATADGKEYRDFCINTKDIIGMWEDIKLTSEQVLEKAYRENLKVTFPKALLTNGYEVIAKTKHNSYIIRNGSYIVDSCNLDDVTFSIYEGKKGNEPENLDIDNTITVTLPKPFKPKEGQAYYYISDTGDLLVEHFNPNEMLHVITRDTGRCFRTHEDAQEWLDAAKNALDN